jgi:hypothetical protein
MDPQRRARLLQMTTLGRSIATGGHPAYFAGWEREERDPHGKWVGEAHGGEAPALDPEVTRPAAKPEEPSPKEGGGLLDHLTGRIHSELAGKKHTPASLQQATPDIKQHVVAAVTNHLSQRGFLTKYPDGSFKTPQHGMEHVIRQFLIDGGTTNDMPISLASTGAPMPTPEADSNGNTQFPNGHTRSAATTKLARSIQKQTHTVQDVIDGKFHIGTESGGGKGLKAAEKAGLYTADIGGLHVYARSKADTFPLAEYLAGGGRYGTPEFSRLMGYTPAQVEEYKKFLQADNQHDLLTHDDNRGYSPPKPPPEAWQLSRKDYKARIAAAPNDKYKTSHVEDWGNNRGQGKRVGGMVKGAMADPPRGKKTYTSILGALPEHELRDTVALENHHKIAYARARAAGFDHEQALSEAFEVDDPKEFDAHKFAVRDALDAGKPVPAHVAAEYPELSSGSIPVEAAATKPPLPPVGTVESAESVLGRVKASPNQPPDRDWAGHANRFGIEGDFTHAELPTETLRSELAAGNLRGSNTVDPAAVARKVESGDRNPVIISKEPGRGSVVVDGNHSLHAAIDAGDTSVRVLVGKNSPLHPGAAATPAQSAAKPWDVEPQLPGEARPAYIKRIEQATPRAKELKTPTAEDVAALRKAIRSAVPTVLVRQSKNKSKDVSIFPNKDHGGPDQHRPFTEEEHNKIRKALRKGGWASMFDGRHANPVDYATSTVGGWVLDAAGPHPAYRDEPQ